MFRLRTELRKRNALDPGSGIEAYSASKEEVTKLAYFSLSVIWRASLCDWPCRGRTYHPIDLGPYQEEMRRYLNGECGLPTRVGVILILSQLNTPVLTFSLPVSYRADGSRCHGFHIPGMDFVVPVGKDVPHSRADLCILRPPRHPVFVSKVGDEQTQEEIMKLMGKVAPPWGEYPLIDGVEKVNT